MEPNFFGGVDIGLHTINLLLSILFVCFPCRILAMSTKCPGPGPRKASPHHIDSITKELKYVDPTHRACVPGFKAASFTPKKKKDKYHGRTHNCIASMRMTSGDMYAVRIILHLSMWIVFLVSWSKFLCGNLTTPILLLDYLELCRVLLVIEGFKHILACSFWKMYEYAMNFHSINCRCVQNLSTSCSCVTFILIKNF